MKLKLLAFSALMVILSVSYSQVRIKMQQEGGVYTTQCKVNGLKLRFIFDTGASNVSISLSEALFMLKNGYLCETDLSGSSYSQLANGDIVENTTINLREFEVGGIQLYNVEAIIIHEMLAPLLLGQSAIQELGEIKIDGDELVLLNHDPPSSANACLEAVFLKHDAQKYYNDNLYSMSADAYQKAYDLCPDMLECYGIHSLGRSYYELDQFRQAVKYLGKVPSCTNDTSILHWSYLFLGESYMELGKLDKSLLNVEKSIYYAYDNNRIADGYRILSEVYFKMDDMLQSINTQKENIKYLLLSINSSEADIMNGKVHNLLLGGEYFHLSYLYFSIKLSKESDRYMIKSALCGFQSAIEYCDEFGLEYDILSE